MNANEITIVSEDYKAIATDWLSSTGNLQKFTDNEKKQFIDICCAYGLNPVKKEIYGIKYGDKFNLIVGYESYIKRAERSGQLDGWECSVTGTGNDLVAHLTIHRKDWSKPFTHEVYFEEYNTNQNLWKSKPKTMLKKVCIAQGFRMCFSEELGGIPYTSEELGEKLSDEINITKTATATKRGELKDAPLPPSYTKEQAEECGSLLHTLNADGNPYFTETEIAEWRQYLIDNGGDKTLEEVKKALQEKMNA